MSGEPPLDFYYRSVDRFADWIKHADAKAGAALVVLGLGLSDLVDHTRELADAHSDGGAGWVATTAFWAACLIAASVVFRVVRAFFPRLAARGERSVFYFGEIAVAFGSPAEYRAAVEAKTDDDVAAEVGAQAWELARIADEKFRQSQAALLWTLLFLAAWAIGRVALGYAR
jgi:hypothetical protein